MPSVMRIVEEIVSRKPFIQEALLKEILNYAAYAEQIKSEIEFVLRKEVKNAAIVMALRRLSEKLQEQEENVMFNFFENMTLSLKTDLFLLVLDRSKDIEKIVDSLHLETSTRETFSITKGVDEVSIISSMNFHNKIIDKFKPEDILKSQKNLGGLTISIPKDIVGEVGFFYSITKTLSWENISIIEIVSTLSELTFILNEDDLTRSFNSIKSLINKNK